MFERPDAYKYERRNWFSDQLWKLLVKMGCIQSVVDTTEVYYTATFHSDDIAKAVLKVMHSMQMAHMVPKHVYMSNAVFEQLIHEARYTHERYNTFLIQMEHGGAGGRRLYNVPVTIIPHMEGILVV